MNKKLKTLRSLDINPYIGEVEISGGEITLEVPKLSAVRILELVKFLGSEVSSVWGKIQAVMNDSSYTEREAIGEVVKVIPSHMMASLLSILLDIDEESAELLDLNDVLEIALVYVQNTNLKNTFFQIRKIYKEIYGKELPNLSDLLPSVEEVQTVETPEKTEVDGKNQSA